MIVETDFLDHWKTQMLIEMLGDPASHCYLLRLWAHCQTRKENRFAPGKMKPAILKAITRAPHEAEMLVKGCDKSRKAGLSVPGIKEWLFQEVEKILGEINTGERERGKPAASAFTARMQEYFATVDKPMKRTA